MFDLKYLRSHWFYAISIAVAIQLLFLLHQTVDKDDDDLKSAIKRAKTSSCKQELRDAALRLRPLDGLKITLKRTCIRDLKLQRNQKVGCVNNASAKLSRIDYPAANSTICLDLCFSYGHSHGGYDDISLSCYCGESLDMNITKSTNCSESIAFDWFKVDNGIYDPSGQTLDEHVESSERKQVRIAFLLTLHGRGLQQVFHLIDTIYTESHIYLIHVDKRDNHLFNELAQLYSGYDNIVVTSSRFRTIWGGPSLLRMVIESIKSLIPLEWDYLINLSGSDFPVKSIEDLERFLASNPETIYLKFHSMKRYSFIKKQGLDRNFYECEDRVWNLGRRTLPRGIVYSGGSDWFALPRSFCAFIDAHSSDSKSLVKPLLQIYNYTLLPVESFFHTLAINSEFCDKVQDSNLRLTNWRRKKACKCQHKKVVDWCGCSPSTFRSSDWSKLSQTINSSRTFFARKFDMKISSGVIAKVRSDLLKKSSQSPDTRYWENIYNLKDDTQSSDSKIVALKRFARLSSFKFLGEHNMTDFRLESIHLHFNEDRFRGWLLHYCAISQGNFCHQVLIDSTPRVGLNHTNECVTDNGQSLKVIAINHGFDAGERIFRDYFPMHQMSDIAVYHEWEVDPLVGASNTTGRVEFFWQNPDRYVELRQTVTLRRPQKRSRLTLAHRMNVPKSITAGLWHLLVKINGYGCLRYQFLVIHSTSADHDDMGAKMFGQFYSISGHCTIAGNRTNSNTDITNLKQDCNDTTWSSVHSIEGI